MVLEAGDDSKISKMNFSKELQYKYLKRNLMQKLTKCKAIGWPKSHVEKDTGNVTTDWRAVRMVTRK